MQGENLGASVRAAGPEWEMGDAFFLAPFLPSGGQMGGRAMNGCKFIK